MEKIPELLAPAGSMDALKAALNAGADAVYIAGKQFGARHYAANFDEKEIKEAVKFAHLREVKIYVTVNTLIKDIELKEIAKYLIFLHKIGVDAILVQDIGVAKLARKLVPDLKLHASTQMTIHNLEGVKWASEMGFKRVVLSREMELSEIENISKNIKSEEIELEIFAHGALCYSYSGQCLISSFIGGRSGNRGMCAQPCRRQYNLVIGEKDGYGRPFKLKTFPIKEKYLLSTRDLAIYEHLDKISRLYPCSIKIEGRMRSPEYVAIVVNIYRNALDLIARGKWKSKKEDIDTLKLAFNRDFTGGYILENNCNKVMGRNLPGNRGIYIGSLLKYEKSTNRALFKIKGDVYPQKGDGIVFVRPNTDEKDYGMLINESPEIYKNRIKFKVRRDLKPGTSLYLTRSKVLVDKAHKIINGSESKLKNQILVDLNILIENNGNIKLKSKFNGADGILKLEMNADFKMQKAINRPLEKKTLEKHFKKTGGTPFKVENMNIEYSGHLFAPIGELNRVRRELFKKIEEKIISSYKPSKNKIKRAYNQFMILEEELNISSNYVDLNKKNPDLSAYIDNLEVLIVAAEAGFDKIYFNPFNRYNPTECTKKVGIKNDEFLRLIYKSISICKENEVELILKLPKITSSYFLDNVKPLLILAFKTGLTGVMVDGMGAAKFISDLNPQIDIYASSGLNIWNFESVVALEDYFKCLTVSPELSSKEILNVVSKSRQRKIKVELALLVQGNLESMISKDCLPCIISDRFNLQISEKTFTGIKDVTNHIFPLKLDNECRTHILNSVELSLIDYMPKILEINIDNVLIDMEGRTGKYAVKICSFYKDVIEMELDARENKNNLNKMKEKVKNMSLGGITTGNFLRGITGR